MPKPGKTGSGCRGDCHGATSAGGIEVRTETLATALFEGINFKGDFLKQKITRDLFSKEQHVPSSVIDRDSIRGWQASGSPDAFARARARTRELLAAYEQPRYTPEQERELRTMVENLARKAGMDALPKRNNRMRLQMDFDVPMALFKPFGPINKGGRMSRKSVLYTILAVLIIASLALGAARIRRRLQQKKWQR